METTLIFHEGVELPDFAAFVLLDNPEGRQKLKRYYEAYLAVAREHGCFRDLENSFARRFAFPHTGLQNCTHGTVFSAAGVPGVWRL
jgi:hypothetical protein